MFRCPNCGEFVNKARLDVYWCHHCERSWLLKNLGYKSLKEASEVSSS